MQRRGGIVVRADLLAVDASASLSIIKLKRTEDSDYIELQAVRIAAMVLTMTFNQGRRPECTTAVSGDEDVPDEPPGPIGLPSPNHQGVIWALLTWGVGRSLECDLLA